MPSLFLFKAERNPTVNTIPDLNSDVHFINLVPGQTITISSDSAPHNFDNMSTLATANIDKYEASYHLYGSSVFSCEYFSPNSCFISISTKQQCDPATTIPLYLGPILPSQDPLTLLSQHNPNQILPIPTLQFTSNPYNHPVPSLPRWMGEIKGQISPLKPNRFYQIQPFQIFWLGLSIFGMFTLVDLPKPPNITTKLGMNKPVSIQNQTENDPFAATFNDSFSESFVDFSLKSPGESRLERPVVQDSQSSSFRDDEDEDEDGEGLGAFDYLGESITFDTFNNLEKHPHIPFASTGYPSIRFDQSNLPVSPVSQKNLHNNESTMDTQAPTLDVGGTMDDSLAETQAPQIATQIISTLNVQPHIDDKADQNKYQYEELPASLEDSLDITIPQASVHLPVEYNTAAETLDTATIPYIPEMENKSPSFQNSRVTRHSTKQKSLFHSSGDDSLDSLEISVSMDSTDSATQSSSHNEPEPQTTVDSLDLSDHDASMEYNSSHMMPESANESVAEPLDEKIKQSIFDKSTDSIDNDEPPSNKRKPNSFKYQKHPDYMESTNSEGENPTDSNSEEEEEDENDQPLAGSMTSSNKTKQKTENIKPQISTETRSRRRTRSSSYISNPPSVLQSLKSSTKRNCSDIYILLTGIVSTKYPKFIESLGGYVTKDPQECTHVIMGTFKRTAKLLEALCRGCYILTEQWIIDSNQNGQFLPEANYFIQDSEGESLQKPMERALSKPDGVFSSYFGAVVGQLPKGGPQLEDVSKFFLCGGGTFIDILPDRCYRIRSQKPKATKHSRNSKSSNANKKLVNFKDVKCFNESNLENLLIFISPDDSKTMDYLSAQGVNIYDIEGLLTSLLKQKYEMDDFRLNLKNDPDNDDIDQGSKGSKRNQISKSTRTNKGRTSSTLSNKTMRGTVKTVRGKRKR